MTDTTMGARSTPWHLWVVGVLTLLWNCGGVFDYVMSVTRNPDYMAQMTAEQAALITSAPAWATAAFAAGTWSSLAGSLLLLLRRRWAMWAFALSLAALVVNSIYYFALSKGTEVMGAMAAGFTALLIVIMLFEIWYSRMMAKRGVLR